MKYMGYKIMENVNGHKVNYAKFFIICFIIAGAVFFTYEFQRQQEQEEPKSVALQEPPMVISIGMWDAKQYLNGDPLLEEVEKKLNIKLVAPVNITYMNWTEEYQKLAASNALPDIISHDIIGTSTYSTWVDQNLVSKIPNDLSKYPLLQSYVDQEYNDYFRNEKGELYCIPRITYPNEESWALDRCIVVRTDWMEKLGIAMPQSFEEFENMLYRFTTEDPDGNGIDDTCGLSIANMNVYEALYLSIFPELSNVERGWMKEDGKWMPVYCSKKTEKALSYAKRLYEKGLLDSGFAYQSSEDARKSFAFGKTGAIATQYLGIATIWDEYNTDKDITEVAQVMRPWKAEDNNLYRFTTSLHWSETYINGQVGEAKMDKILELYNYLLSDEFKLAVDKYSIKECPSMEILSILVQWNQEDSYLNKGKYKDQYSKETLDYANQELAWYRDTTKRVDYNWDIVFLSSEYKDQLPSYKEIQFEMIKVIIGDEDAAIAWNESLAKLKSKTTLEKAIEEVTIRAEKLNLPE